MKLARVTVLAALAVAARVPAAHAYDPATTHAGLTERAALASELHRVLARALSRPLGLFEPIALSFDQLPTVAGPDARGAAGGARSVGRVQAGGPDGVAPALAWVIAGSVIATTPAERGQDFFYDPSRGAGLSQAGGLTSLGNTLGLLLDTGGGFRAFFTGTQFNMTGRPSTEWLRAPENDVGLEAFHVNLEAAVAGETPQVRATALARALLALGGVLTVLEDAGEPAHVRNDYRRAYLATAGPSPFDRGSAFEHFVAETYGRMGLPAGVTPKQRPTLMAFITAADGQGLADRTQRRFFSEGSLPEDAVVDRGTTPAEVMVDARGSLPYAYPRLPRLELKVMGRRHYAYTQDKRRLLAYERVPGRVRFFLDDGRVRRHRARAAAGDRRLWRRADQPPVPRRDPHRHRHGRRCAGVGRRRAGQRSEGRGPRLRRGRVGRAQVRSRRSSRPRAGVRVTVPAGTKKVAAVLRGEDDAGDFVAVGESAIR